MRPHAELLFLALILHLFTNVGVQSFLVAPIPHVDQQSQRFVPSVQTTTIGTKRRTTLSAWKSCLSTDLDPDSALQELLSSIGPEDPDIAFLFISSSHAGSFKRLVKHAWEQLPKATQLMALVGGGIVGQGSEVDRPNQPAMSMLSGTLPKGATVEMLSFNELNNPPPDDPKFWKELQSNHDYSRQPSGQDQQQQRPPSFLLFVDPWSPIDTILQGLRGSVVAGGISVPAQASFQPTVAMNGEPLPQGSAVILRWTGTMGLQAIVSQGCRPVGPIFTVTKTTGNALEELDGVPALQKLQKVANDASAEDRKLMSAAGYLVGIASANGVERGTSSSRTDFLIRQIVGFQPDKGAVVVGSRDVQLGDRVRFHVRDAQTARDDMKLQMERTLTERLFAGGRAHCGTPVAALQVSCVARGQGMFECPNVDVSYVSSLFENPTDETEEGASAAAPPPVAGFFANGEIGPVGVAGFQPHEVIEGTYMHGFTTVVGLLCDFSPISSDPSLSSTECLRIGNSVQSPSIRMSNNNNDASSCNSPSNDVWE